MHHSANIYFSEQESIQNTSGFLPSKLIPPLRITSTLSYQVLLGYTSVKKPLIFSTSKSN